MQGMCPNLLAAFLLAGVWACSAQAAVPLEPQEAEFGIDLSDQRWRLGEGIAARDHLRATTASLAGKWLLTMAVGAKFDITIEADPRPDHWIVRREGEHNLMGVYKLHEDRLTLVEPQRNPRYRGLVWEVNADGTLLLVEHPEEARLGSNYEGATLARQEGAPPRRGERRPE